MTVTAAGPKTWDDVEVNLAAALPGYQQRPQQQMLARAIEIALAAGGTLLAQAGCGTGKSFGGMIPIVLDTIRRGDRAIVATPTKALQEQYANSDVPFLQANSGMKFTWALLKGRSNYACRAKMTGEEASRIEVLPALKAEIRENPEISGDREHFATVIEDEDWWKLSTSAAECPGKKECPFGEVCFAELAKTKALKADLVITNTTLAMIDAGMRLRTKDRPEGPIEMLGHYETILFDEGHKIPEQAASALGTEFTANSVGSWVKKALTFISLQAAPIPGEDVHQDDRPALATAISDRISAAMRAISDLLMPRDDNGRLKEPPMLSLAWFSEHFQPFFDLTDAVIELREMVEETRIVHDAEAQRAKMKMISKVGYGIAENVQNMAVAEDHVYVRWVEVFANRRGEDTWKVMTSPVDVAPFLKEAFWDQKNAVVMSATLSSGRDADGNADFTYMRRTMGLLEGNVDAVDVGTPFDYPKQTLMFVPGEEIPSPKSDRQAWRAYSMTTILQIIDMAQGGVLSLFTSRSAMQESYDALAPTLRDMGYTVLMQGNREPGHQFTNKQLAQMFKDDTHSILFGLETFFTGVDFQGDACRAVIIDKLPFPVPSDPIFAARCLAEEKAGRAPFYSLSIPVMTLTLEQGAGRLIRTVQDTGVIAVLDSRLTSTPYGRSIVRALPDFPVTTELSQVREFYARTRG